MEFLASFTTETIHSAAAAGSASLEFLKSEFFSSVLLPSLVSGGIIYLARRRGWHKSRNHYDISFEKYDTSEDTDNQQLLNKLNSGKYEILSAKKPHNRNEIQLIMAKIKKDD